MRPSLGLVFVACLAGCARPPASSSPGPVSSATVARPVASARAEAAPRILPAASCAHLTIRGLPAVTPADWGSTQPSVWLTERGAGLDVWYPSGPRAPYEMSALDSSGALGATSEVAPFAGMGEADDPVIASENGRTALAETVYRTRRNSDVVVALRSNGRWSKPLALLPGPDLDSDPAIAFSDGELGVAWKHGAYPGAPDLSFAIVERDGRVKHGGVIEHDAQAEGMALVGVPNGWLLIYTPSSALPRSRRGVVSLAFDRTGRVVSRHVIVRGDGLWPVAAWNGRQVGVAFRARPEGRDVVAFVRLAADGTALAAPVVADRHPDPLASFRPLSLVPARPGWWLADVTSFAASVIVARPSEGRVVELGADGRRATFAVVSDRSSGASLVRLARRGEGVRGVFVEDRGAQQLHAFDVACASAPPPRSPPDPCAARLEPYPAGRFVPLQGLVESAVELNGDVLLGYRPLQGAQRATAGNVLVSRMSRDGRVAWTADLGAAYNPRLAVRRGRAAVLVGTHGGSVESLVMLDATSGAVTAKRRVAQDVREGCIAATRSGWMVVNGAPYDGKGKPVAWTLDASGAPRGREVLGDRLEACALLPMRGGFLIAYTHSGNVSETSYLFLRTLDASGRPRAPGRRVPDVGFATEPALFRHGKQALLLFEGALGRNLSALALDDRGVARSPTVGVAETYGLDAAFLWGDQIVWSTDQGVGRRACLDRLLARPAQ
jgi:hypothetical protein